MIAYLFIKSILNNCHMIIQAFHAKMIPMSITRTMYAEYPMKILDKIVASIPMDIPMKALDLVCF